MPAGIAQQITADGWPARLALEFRHDGSRTFLSRRRSYGPLQIQRPFYPGNGVCHAYLLHPPGGIVGGDRLDIEIDAGPDTRLLVTTPAAAKFYRSGGAVAEQRLTLRVGTGAVVESLPQESIVFAGAQARSVTRIELDDGARFIGWEIVCLGRPASAERFDRGWFSQRLELYLQGRPLLLERNRFDGGGAVMSARWGLADLPVNGILVATGCDAHSLATVQDVLQFEDRCERGSASRVDGLLVVRYQGRCTERARDFLSRCRELLPRDDEDRPAGRPRIWDT